MIIRIKLRRNKYFSNYSNTTEISGKPLKVIPCTLECSKPKIISNNRFVKFFHPHPTRTNCIIQPLFLIFHPVQRLYLHRPSPGTIAVCGPFFGGSQLRKYLTWMSNESFPPPPPPPPQLLFSHSLVRLASHLECKPRLCWSCLPTYCL